MTDPSPRYFPRNAKPESNPEIPPPAGDLPKRFPEKQPLSDDGLESAKRDAANPMRSGSGEDPLVESGQPDNDPERPKQTDEEISAE